ncbi:hypothetical protein OIU78_015440 [Salix suchowensis]|nr:hypothetical protein OIU78_015440 [Salix suchowensis]
MEEAKDPRNGGDSSPTQVSKKPRISGYITEQEIHEEFSHHNPNVARINNGSFGSCPGSVLAAQKNWQLQFLQQPDDFYFNTLRKGILHSRTVIKNLINADDVDEISLVDNATTAAAIVLQQIGRAFAEGKFAKNDTVLMLHCAYEAVKKSIQAYVTRAGGSVIEELVKICREEGVEQVFVDAAHAIGSVDINVKEIGADFYVSNLHKWFFCPPSVAFLYCKKASSELDVHHLVVSHEYGNGLPIESAWVGTRDYSSQLVVPAALEFVNRFEDGIQGIMKRNHEEVVKMGRMLAESWRTNLGSPPEMCAGMIMVGLPSRLRVSSEDDALRFRDAVNHLAESRQICRTIYPV